MTWLKYLEKESINDGSPEKVTGYCESGQRDLSPIALLKHRKARVIEIPAHARTW